MDLILRNAFLADRPGRPVDIGIAGGRIAAIEDSLAADGQSLDVSGCLVSSGFVETHIHLDKSCIMERCRSVRGDITEAIEEVAKAKRGFTAEDVYARARRTVEKAILHGTTDMRTHVEVDPGIGLVSLDAIEQLARDYAFALGIEICVFPQEGMTNNPGTEELMIAAMKRGARVVGAAPYTDSDPHGQIDRVFAIARDFDADIDMHLDFGRLDGTESLDLDYVCAQTEKFGRGGRVAIGHVTKLSYADPERFAGAARRLADAGVALTVLPATDLFLMGRDRTHAHSRGVTRAHDLLAHGVNCSLSTNNVLNPFTPYGDASLVRMANLNANICHIASAADLAACFAMVTTRAAKLMNLGDYGLSVGKSADLVVIDGATPEGVVAEVAPVLASFKRGRPVMTRARAEIHRPG
ncbi:amidohydrolase family protein [Aureimonas sp. SA4125]|uniref:amidohydrolase family protein n=1 Tax=Aureimonas sp. SA4125 TaxID=2826993 RepID=UPI001CC6C1DC|nr:amidohydrolase family protein [Aureimonas sp. SA4125]